MDSSSPSHPIFSLLPLSVHTPCPFSSPSFLLLLPSHFCPLFLSSVPLHPLPFSPSSAPSLSPHPLAPNPCLLSLS